MLPACVISAHFRKSQVKSAANEKLRPTYVTTVDRSIEVGKIVRSVGRLEARVPIAF